MFKKGCQRHIVIVGSLFLLSIMECRDPQKETIQLISSQRTVEWALANGRRRAGLASEKAENGKSSLLNTLRGIIPISAD